VSIHTRYLVSIHTDTTEGTMTASTIVKASEVAAGDLITETDTPEGPFYAVLKVNAKSVVVDADEFYGTADACPMPVRLSIRSSDAVRRAV
jgi:hypothetical protein